MTELAATPTETLELIRRISSPADADLGPSLLLKRTCEAIVETLAFERISGVRYDRQADEVSEWADAGIPTAESVERGPIANVPVLAEALETEKLVLASDGRAGELAWVFAVPLVRDERFLGFLTGERRAVPLDQGEVEVLVTVASVVAALLESALARKEAQRLDALKSEFIALAAHELRNSVSTIYGVCVTMDEVVMHWASGIGPRFGPCFANRRSRCATWSNSCSISPVSTWRRSRSSLNRFVCDRESRSLLAAPPVPVPKR